MAETTYQQCAKTVMDNIADPNIKFDKSGICNYWQEYKVAEEKYVIHGEKGDQLWADSVAKMKQFGKGKKYDCLVGVSGGLDSTYIAYLVKEANLRPLVVHFDNGWNSEIAVQNINNIINYLDADLHTLVIDWDEFKDLQRAYIKAGVVDIEALTDHAIFGTLYKIAAKYNIKHVMSGDNVETEFLLPKAWGFNKVDSVNIKDIHSKYGTLNLKSYPFFSILIKKYYLNFKKLEFVAPINWMKYNKSEVKDIIMKEIGWKDYGGKHHESVFTKFYQNYILPQKFKIDKRKAHLSNLICSGQITKEQALIELDKPVYDPNELKIDKEYVVKKLGFSIEEFDSIMEDTPKSHKDFKIEGPIYQHYPILKPVKWLYDMTKR
jgi:N-acetyl sugar amidotransferase